MRAKPFHTSLAGCLLIHPPDLVVRPRQAAELYGRSKYPIRRVGELCCFHSFNLSSTSPLMCIARCDSGVFTSSTFWQTIPRSMLNLALSQSTSDHRRARHSLMRRPKQTHIRAIVLNGSSRCCTKLWNSSTVSWEVLPRDGRARIVPLDLLAASIWDSGF